MGKGLRLWSEERGAPTPPPPSICIACRLALTPNSLLPRPHTQLPPPTRLPPRSQETGNNGLVFYTTAHSWVRNVAIINAGVRAHPAA